MPTKREAALLEERMGLADESVALLRLLPDGEQRDRGLGDAEDLLCEDRAHVPELDEVLGPRVRVRSRVDQDGGAADGRKRHGDRGPVDIGEPADLEEAGGQHRAGVPGGHDRGRVPLADRAAGGEHRASALLARGIGGLLVHLDDVGGVDDLQAMRQRLERVAAPEKDRLDGVGSCRVRARDDLLRGPIAAHRVDRDPDSRHALRSRSLERLDFTPAIGAAGRADVMWPLRPMALRALDDGGCRELVRRAPLVAPRLRGLSLGDCHGRAGV